jgi:tripartite-type tricarboxylate transporter receptor subunit TctC
MQPLLASALLACAVLGVALPARADTFPNKPVTLVIPFAPGGSSDGISRIVGQELSRKWKQPVLIDNRSGGQTMIGTGYVAKAPADGYTIGYVSYAFTTNQFLVKNMPYQASDLAPVTLLGRYPLALFVKGDLPVNSLAEFVALARKSPNPLSFGHAGTGSSSHLAALDFADTVGIKMLPVGYKSGTIGAINDLIGGQIDALFEGRTFKQYVDDKRLKALVLAAPARLRNWPELPAAPEAGYPDLDVSGYFGLVLPARTPRAIQEQIAADVADVLKDERVQERLLALGLQPAPGTPAQFEAFLKDQHARLGKLVERHHDQMAD